MKIIGTVENSKTRAPIMGVKIGLRIEQHGQNKSFVILSDKHGRFACETEDEYGILNICAKKAGFGGKNLSYKINESELQINIFLDEVMPLQQGKKWYILKDFLSTNASIIAKFLIDQIEDYKNKWGENEELEVYKEKIESYKEKTDFSKKELDEYLDIIRKLEEILGSVYISENAFVNGIIDKIKPKKSAFKIEIWAEKDDYKGTRDTLKVQKPEKNYKVGDKINICFRSEKDCYIFLLNYGTSGKLTVLFPNALFDDNFIKGNTIYAIPGEEYDFDYILIKPSGREKIKAIAATNKFDLIDLNFKKGQIFSMSTSAARDISIAAKKIESSQMDEWAEAICEIKVE